ncbi:MAG: hypothetical protein CFH13_00476 [Alphaproteobacteria bacterium MarineAlpha5_Bin3]|jgi:hypothetical protein|nr:MAG: hypothetical protein CFH13_00476 [Alphaproteobacteria bacterium MarineAlpha5_Bin3]
MKSLLYNFWFGKITLWKSYWIVGELINALIIFLIFNIEINYFNNINIYNQLPFINFDNFHFFNKIILIIWTIYITVGIWRSAEKYKGSFIWVVLTLIFLSYRIFTLRLIFF